MSVAATESPPAVANGFVYYVHSPSHNLRASPENGGAEVVVSSEIFGGSYPNQLAVNAEYAFIGNSNLDRVTLSSGTSDLHGSFFFFASDLGVDAEHVYYVSTYDVGGNYYQSLGRRSVLSPTGGSLTGDYESFTAALALDATHVYFAAGTGIAKLAK